MLLVINFLRSSRTGEGSLMVSLEEENGKRKSK